VSQEKSEALVLRGVDFSESSRIITFLCPERGRMACLAQGARRTKSGAAALLETFNRLELVYYWKDSREVQKLGEASLLDDFAPLKRDLDKSVYAAFPLEIALKTAQANEPSHDLYDALVAGLDSMKHWSGDAAFHASWQAVQLLAAAGFAPGAHESDAALPARLRRSRGRDWAAEFAQRPEAPPDPAACTRGDGQSVFEYIGAYAQHHLDTDFRSRRVIARMFAD
jgi:DNA repair protein RecO (recombination protein O)